MNSDNIKRVEISDNGVKVILNNDEVIEMERHTVETEYFVRHAPIFYIDNGVYIYEI